MTGDRDSGALLSPDAGNIAALPGGPPMLLISVDTEEEFDWRGPYLRTLTAVRNLGEQRRAQDIYDRLGVQPIYLVDYAVASQPEGYLPLREIAASGRCEIGAHLHPWVTPPFAEQLGPRNSFSQNLPASLQRDKLARLTDTIAANLGVRPICYRAGRLGVGDEIAGILEGLGYEIDMSVLPGIDLRAIHGPDFRRCLDRPYWFGSSGTLLEIPGTCGFTGALAHRAAPRALAVELYNRLGGAVLRRLRARGLFARLRLLEQTPLSPEGVELAELRRVTCALLARGNRVFVMSYHSSSLLPGSTEYVRSPAELAGFLRTIEQYLEFFFGELGGIATTPSGLRAVLPGHAGIEASAVAAQ